MNIDKRVVFFLDYFTYNRKKAFLFSALIMSAPFTFAVCHHRHASLLEIMVVLLIFSINAYLVFNLLFARLQRKLWETSPRMIDLQKALEETKSNIKYHSSTPGLINYMLTTSYEDSVHGFVDLPLFFLSVEQRSNVVVAASYHITEEINGKVTGFKTVRHIITNTSHLCFAQMNGVGKNGVFIDVSMAGLLMKCLQRNLSDYESGLGTRTICIKARFE